MWSFQTGPVQELFLPAPQSRPANPRTPQAMPLTSSQVVLLVGEPVKARETSEPKELLALTPKTTRTIPAARSAKDIPIANPLFITVI